MWTAFVLSIRQVWRIFYSFFDASYVSTVLVWMTTLVSPFCHASLRVVIVLVTLHELWKIIDFRFGRQFFSLGHLGFKEFLFRMAQTIISMFALQTRAAHLLLDCPPDTLRCALTASQSSVGGKVGEWGEGIMTN